LTAGKQHTENSGTQSAERRKAPIFPLCKFFIAYSFAVNLFFILFAEE
jgi:hypothetical protein